MLCASPSFQPKLIRVTRKCSFRRYGFLFLAYPCLNSSMKTNLSKVGRRFCCRVASPLSPRADICPRAPGKTKNNSPPFFLLRRLHAGGAILCTLEGAVRAPSRANEENHPFPSYLGFLNRYFRS